MQSSNEICKSLKKILCFVRLCVLLQEGTRQTQLKIRETMDGYAAVFHAMFASLRAKHLELQFIYPTQELLSYIEELNQQVRNIRLPDKAEPKQLFANMKRKVVDQLIEFV